jgi:O-antigen/teichoic acid export membrane protein
MTPIVRRVVAGLGANAFGQAVNVGIQVLSLPLFLYRWDLPTYGTWLMLSAIPSYLSMADVGMLTVGGNRMTMAMGRGDVAEANCLFQSMLTLMSGVCGGLALLAIPIFLLTPLPGVTSFDERGALLALAFGVLAALYGGLADIAFKSTHRFASGVMLANLTRLGEWCGGIAGLFWNGTFTAVALGMLGARAAGTAAAIWVAFRGRREDLCWGVRLARRSEALTMVRPAVSFMAFPLANALTLQSVTLLVGHLFGPSIVALFNAYRTIARVAVQATSIFSLSLWPEFSRLYGKNGPQAIASLYRRAAILGAASSVGLSVALYAAAPTLLHLWTRGAVGLDATLMAFMLAYAAAVGVSHVPRIVLISTNLHTPLARWSLILSAAVPPSAYVAGLFDGIDGVALAMLSAEALVALVCFTLAQRVVREVAPVTAGVHP